MKRKVIFLTGGSGFIGRNILEQLRHKYTFIAPTHKELNLLNTDEVDAFFKRNHVDVVVHCAHLGGNRNTPYIPDAVEKNMRMFCNLIRNQNFFTKMIHFGSGAEYDKQLPIVRVKESDFGKHIPEDQYGFSKYICSKYAENPAGNIVILRPFGVFGKYEDYKTRFISNAIYDILLDKPILINQNVFFDYLYINDLVRIVEYFIEHETKKKSYNIGTGKSVNLVTIAKRLKAISKSKSPIVVKKKGLNKEYTCDNSLLLSELRGFRFTDLDDSLRELYAWYVRNRTIYGYKIVDNTMTIL